LISSTTLAIGLFRGFDQPVFALAVAISTIVIYDAAGVRRQAGIHAERINLLLKEIFQGRPVQENDLKEMLGHTPIEVLGGVIVGLVSALFLWLMLPKYHSTGMLKSGFACTFLYNHLLCIGNFVGSWLQNPPQACTFAHPAEPDVSHSRYPHGVVYRFCTCSFFLVRIQCHDVLKNPVLSWHFPDVILLAHLRM